MIRDVRGDQTYWDEWINSGLSSIEDRKDIIEGIRTKRPGYSSDDSGCILNIVRDYKILPMACYSRGDSIKELYQYFAPLLSYWEQYEAAVVKQKDDTDWYRTKWSVNLNTYIMSFWWIGLALSLEIPDDQWQRLLKLIGNEGEDELLDRIIACRQKNRKIGTKLCHPKPYQLLLDAINAPKEQQAQKLFLFVDNWYKQLGDKKRPYLPKGMPKTPSWYDFVKYVGPDGWYFGNWCIEAVAAVKAFNLDDSLCLGHENYPGDLLRPNGPTTHKAGAIPKENKDDKEAEKDKDAFLAAAENRDMKTIEALIKKGVDINAQDKHGATALVLVCHKKYSEITDRSIECDEIANKLIECGADVNIDTDAGETALMYAADCEDKELTKKLLTKGANPNEQDECGRTPLIRTHNADIVKILVDNGANINQVDYAKYSPLMQAAREECLDKVKMLIKLGADLNLQNSYGYTALILAAGWGHPEIVSTLIDAGANSHISNDKGATAFDVVNEIITNGYYDDDTDEIDANLLEYNAKNYEEISKILRKHKAK